MSQLLASCHTQCWAHQCPHTDHANLDLHGNLSPSASSVALLGMPLHLCLPHAAYAEACPDYSCTSAAHAEPAVPAA